MKRYIILMGIFSIVTIFGGNIFADEQESQAKTKMWLKASFEEINSSSPMVGEANITTELAAAIAAALPNDLKKEAADAGFDVDIISQTLLAMPKDGDFQITKDDYNLKVKKIEKIDSEERPTYLIVKSNKFNIPVPLMLTGTAVGLLQFSFKELADKREELTHAINILKETSPGLIFKGRDELMDEWLEITLK